MTTITLNLSPGEKLSFSVPAKCGGTCCAYQSFTISPPPRMPYVQLSANDFVLNLQNCNGHVQLTKDNAFVTFSPYIGIRLNIVDDPDCPAPKNYYTVTAQVQHNSSCSMSPSSSAIAYTPFPKEWPDSDKAHCVDVTMDWESGTIKNPYTGDPRTRPTVPCYCRRSSPGSCPH